MAELPKYLDTFIFNELNGFFQPGQNVDLNMENDDFANRRYIGTYFSRSLVECYTIFFDLFANHKIKEVFDNLEDESNDLYHEKRNYQVFYDEHFYILGHYFRYVFNIIKFIYT